MTDLKQGSVRQSVLITGASGLLGAYVAEAFRVAGYDVLATDIAQNSCGNVVIADLKELDTALQLVKNVDHVVHIASLPRPVGYAVEDIYTTNNTLIFNVVEAMERNNINSLIYASSFSVTGLPFANKPVIPPYFPLDSQSPLQAQDIYALTKLLGEQVVEYWVARTGGRAVGIRMPWIQTQELFARDVVPRRDTDEARLDLWAYLDARDAANAFVQSAQANIEGHVKFFAAATDTYSEQQTLALVKKYYPDVALKMPLEGFAGLISNEEAHKYIGFKPVYSWRDYGLK